MESAVQAPVLERLRPLADAARRLEQVRPLYVISVFVVVEWLVTLALALTIRHNGWLFYQGGDQTFYYTTSSLLWHRHLIPTSVGYGWSMLLLPLALVDGPNLLNALPAIILIDVLVLMPIAMIATYGIAERIAGRLFGYWTLFLWIAIPLIGIKYVDAGFKAIYSETALPDSFGLTALSDFPQMVALVCAAYFTLRTLQRPTWWDGILAGLLTGAAIGIKPSASLFLVGVVLALVAYRRWGAVLPFAAGIAPSALALIVWKWRGLGYLPLFHAEHAARLALGPSAPPLALGLHKYLSFNWSELGGTLSSLREHFWSERVVEWLAIAGVIALARRSWLAFLLIGGWFYAFVIAKGTGSYGQLENGSLLHKLVPAIPAFVLMMAALPFLFPRVPRSIPRVAVPRPWARPRVLALLTASLAVVFAFVPTAFAVVSQPSTAYGQGDTGPIPIDAGMHLRAVQRTDGSVVLTWSDAKPAGARPYYLVLRGGRGLCGAPLPVAQATCFFAIAAVRQGRYVDRPPVNIPQEYRVVLGANWVDDSLQGDYYLASGPAYAMFIFHWQSP
jgi:hypothetical protein